MTYLPTLSYTSASEISTLLNTWSLKKVPFSHRAFPYSSLCGAHSWRHVLRNEHFVHTLACYRRPFCDSSKNWMSSFSSGWFAMYKNTTDNKLKKKPFSLLKNSVHVEPVWFSLDNYFNSVRHSNYSSMGDCTRLKKISDALKLFSYEWDDLFYCFPQI